MFVRGLGERVHRNLHGPQSEGISIICNDRTVSDLRIAVDQNDHSSGCAAVRALSAPSSTFHCDGLPVFASTRSAESRQPVSVAIPPDELGNRESPNSYEDANRTSAGSAYPAASARLFRPNLAPALRCDVTRHGLAGVWSLKENAIVTLLITLGGCLIRD